jgi:putative transcriptional regulator
MRKKVYKNSIKRFREVKRWRQLDLARRLDIYQSEVSEIERGEREPGAYLALRIAKALGKTVEEVF